MGLKRSALCQVFTVYVATNMMVCALLFAPWALPRETVSGLLGRWKCGKGRIKRPFAVGASWVVDRIYFWERRMLYPEHPGAVPRPSSCS